MAGKWLELLKEIAPRIKRTALLFNPNGPFAEYFVEPFKAAALSAGVEAIKATVHGKSELETVIAAQARERDSGLIVIPDAFLNVNRVDVTALAARHRLLRFIRIAFTRRSVACCPTEMTWSTIIGARRAMRIASSKVPSRASSRCRLPSSSSWSSTSRPPRLSASTCPCFSGSAPTR